MNPILKILTRDLKPALTGLAKVIPRTPQLPVLGCVRIAPDPERDDIVTLTGTDLDTRLQLDIAAEPPIPSEPFLVPLSALREAVKGTRNGDHLVLEPEPHDRVTLVRESGDTRIAQAIATEPASDFPVAAPIEGTPIDLDDKARHALLQALSCASDDPSRQVLRGACLEDGRTMIGTDGRHLFRCNSLALPLERNVILPGSKVFAWKGLRDTGATTSLPWTLALARDSDWFRLAGDDWAFTARLIDGNYPNWRQVMPAESTFKTSITFDRDQLDPIAHTILSLPGAKITHKPVGLRSGNGAVTLLARPEPEAPLTEVPLTGARTSGPAVTVFLNRDYLVKALRFGLNHADIIDELSPVRLREEGTDTRDMIVMPVRTADSSSTAASPRPNHHPEPEPEPMKKETPTPTNGRAPAHATTPPASASKDGPDHSLDTAAAQITAVKDLLRQAAAALNEVAGTLREVKADQKTTEKEIRQVRNTLRTLQKVAL